MSMCAGVLLSLAASSVFAQAQTYRQQYPLPSAYVVGDGLGVNINLPDVWRSITDSTGDTKESDTNLTIWKNRIDPLMATLEAAGFKYVRMQVDWTDCRAATNYRFFPWRAVIVAQLIEAHHMRPYVILSAGAIPHHQSGTGVSYGEEAKERVRQCR
jgi:hypothetical protein